MPSKFILSLVAVGWLVLSGCLVVMAQDNATVESRGQHLLATNCSRCHAIGRTGASSHRQAPPFRTLGHRYPIETLAEALAEGLYTGHPDMPEFIFEIRDVAAILAYLQSIQEP
jgi:cytochrome c